MSSRDPVPIRHPARARGDRRRCAFTASGLHLNLHLKKADGTLLTGRSGNGMCPTISGFDGAGKVPAAAELPAGTYTLEVAGAANGSGSSAATPYRIVAMVR